MERLITIREAAEQEGIATRRIWQLIRREHALESYADGQQVYISLQEWRGFVFLHPERIGQWRRLHAQQIDE